MFRIDMDKVNIAYGQTDTNLVRLATLRHVITWSKSHNLSKRHDRRSQTSIWLQHGRRVTNLLKVDGRVADRRVRTLRRGYNMVELSHNSSENPSKGHESYYK